MAGTPGSDQAGPPAPPPPKVDRAAILRGLPPQLIQAAQKGFDEFDARAEVAQQRRDQAKKAQALSLQADRDAVAIAALRAKDLLRSPDVMRDPRLVVGTVATLHALVKGAGIAGAEQFDGAIADASKLMEQAVQSGDPKAPATVAAQVMRTLGPQLDILALSGSSDVHEAYRKEKGSPTVVAPGSTMVGPDGQPIYTAPEKAAKPPGLQHLETAAGIQTFNPETGALGPVIAKGKPAASPGGGMNAMYSQADPATLADAIVRGEAPPDISTLGRPIGAAVQTALARKGYNLATAQTDWKATQKHVATLNGSQQTRLNQAINALPELLDTVDGLASQWKGGRFPALNKANLALAKGGAYGADVATTARQLEAQIADVNADLAVVYMGGNSPTDHGLELASKALRSDWDEKSLREMVKLAKGNVIIRRNSIQNTGVQGASAGNPYAGRQGEAPAAAPGAGSAPAGVPGAPAAAGPAKRYKFNPVTGKLEPVV
jgi:hypothetical protein